MRYLAFDIECCDGKHICEFGYVITDEKFIVEEKNKHKRFPKIYSSGKIDNTIGAIMRAKGIDLAEI